VLSFIHRKGEGVIEGGKWGLPEKSHAHRGEEHIHNFFKRKKKNSCEKKIAVPWRKEESFFLLLGVGLARARGLIDFGKKERGNSLNKKRIKRYILRKKTYLPKGEKEKKKVKRKGNQVWKSCSKARSTSSCLQKEKGCFFTHDSRGPLIHLMSEKQGHRRGKVKKGKKGWCNTLWRGVFTFIWGKKRFRFDVAADEGGKKWKKTQRYIRASKGRDSFGRGGAPHNEKSRTLIKVPVKTGPISQWTRKGRPKVGNVRCKMGKGGLNHHRKGKNFSSISLKKRARRNTIRKKEMVRRSAESFLRGEKGEKRSAREGFRSGNVSLSLEKRKL